MRQFISLLYIDFYRPIVRAILNTWPVKPAASIKYNLIIRLLNNSAFYDNSTFPLLGVSALPIISPIFISVAAFIIQCSCVYDDTTRARNGECTESNVNNMDALDITVSVSWRFAVY